MAAPTNRRVSARRALRRQATVQMPGGVERVVRTWDVGLDGMSVISPKPIPPGTRCMVTLELPENGDWRPVQLPVKTVYCSLVGPEGVKVGMVFGALDAPTQGALQRFVD